MTWSLYTTLTARNRAIETLMKGVTPWPWPIIPVKLIMGAVFK